MKTLSSAGIKGIFLVILATGFNISVEAQIAAKDLRKQAEQYHQLGQYQEAASVFEIYCPGKPKDAQAWFWWAECQFKSNDLEGALESLQHLENESKRTNPDVVLLLAKTMHQKHEFAAAVKYYKQFLALGLKDGQYQATINDVKRCAAGLKHNYISDDVLIENMGAAVNSKHDDFAPIESPNINSRIYFSSIRALRVVDEFADDGSLKASTQGLD
ncbi:MAG: tetratricopeptide repeat protein, partial [Saprospiraceae bacterium]|nr:tetratricopeptide repeat protein [Saprospiraceae bacterium]